MANFFKHIEKIHSRAVNDLKRNVETFGQSFYALADPTLLRTEDNKIRLL